ncbi:MAG: GDP-mannose 4,6-dehydratase [Candidatus Orphnella occulta]|nr:GDP-mannose 4,6-dehydratase [Candidatus Orphnella occulta]
MGILTGRKVLVTGASGFIGSHLTRLLINEGANVSVVVRYNSIEHNVRLCSLWEKIELFEADIRNIDSLRPLSKRKFDFVFHLAAYNHVGNSFLHVGEVLDTNSNGTANVLETLDHYERFVYISTSEVYGVQDSVPFIEHKYPHPISPYSIGKYTGELYSLMKQREAGRPIVALRPFNAFGPYQSTRAVIPELIVNCLRGVPVLTTEGKQTREFNFVRDLAQGMLLAASSDKAAGEVINLGTGNDIAICDVAKLIHKKTGSKSELKIGALQSRPNEIWKMSSDASKAKKLLGWEPKVDFEEGLDITIEWFRKYLSVYHSADSPLYSLS